MSKALVAYDSLYGNTEKVAKRLAEGLGEGGVAVDCLRVNVVKSDELNSYDLLAVGGPTHSMGVSKPMGTFLEQLKSVKSLSGKKAFAFDTKYKSMFAGSAGAKIEGKLRSLGFTIVRPHVSAIVKGKEGPLEGGAEETFKQLGAELAKIM